MYRTGSLGLFYRPAFISAGSSTPAAAKSWAMPTRPLWPVKPSPRPAVSRAARRCTTDVMTDGSKLVGAAALQEQEETALAVRLFCVGFF